jgi:hypothetical protein
MTKLINLMPLLLDIEEATTLEDCLNRLRPKTVTETGIEVRWENDIEKSYPEGVDLDAEDRKEYHALFDRFTADNPVVDQLAKEVHDYNVETLNGVPCCGGHTGVLSQIINYLVGLTYGSYLREKYGEDCKFLVGAKKSYGWKPYGPMCFLWGLSQGVSGYSDVLAYQHIRKHRYVESPHTGQKRVTDGMAIASMVFVNNNPYGMGDDVFAGRGTPNLIEALRYAIGTKTPTALSVSS